MNKLKTEFLAMEKRFLFMCRQQRIKHKGKKYMLPKCEYVKIDYADYIRLRQMVEDL